MSTLYDIVNILPLPLLAVIAAGRYAGIPGDGFAGAAVCLVFSLWVIILRRASARNRLRSIGIAAVFLAGLCAAAGEENIRRFAAEYFWVIHAVLISAAALTAGIIAGGHIWARRALAAGLLVYCVAGTVLGAEIGNETFALVCFVLLVRTAEEIQRKWEKSGCPDVREHIVRTAPVFLAVSMIVYALPAPEEPYDWQFAKDIYTAAASGISRLYGYITHPSDDYGSIGFSDSGGFLSALNGNDEEVLVISAGNTAIKNCRLVGCVSGDFTGREWVFDTEDESVSRTSDTIETLCAVRKYAGASQSEFLQKTNMYFVTLFYNTRYVFAPAKISLEATKEKNRGIPISERNGSIVSDRRFGYDENYLVSCYVLNYGNPELPELLGGAEEITAGEWEQAARAEGVSGIPGYSFEEHLMQREEIYSRYCRSYGVSEKVGGIIHGIEDGSESRYEKLKRLESYLKKLEYSTDCGALPDTVTDAAGFLDSFLLDSRKGYCMHFATAFVLMANEMGIPCRYVQGYNAKRDISGNMTVMQSSAHAWPEAYFDNVGWVAFEPTPGFSVPAGWGKYDAGAYNYDITEPGADEGEDTDAVPEDAVPLSAETDPLILVIPSAAVIGFLILFYFIGRSVSAARYRRMSAHDRFMYLTRQNFRFLGHLGFKMEQGETLSEFADRVSGSGREDIRELLGFVPVWETVLYSDREITEEDIGRSESINSALRALVKKRGLRFRLMMIAEP